MTPSSPAHPQSKRTKRYKKSKKQPTAKAEQPSFIRKAKRDANVVVEHYADQITTSRRGLDMMREMLLENHNAILSCADLLNRSQPPMAGKIEVRWWKSDGGDMTRPVVVQWGSNGRTKYISYKGLRRKCNSRGKFELNLEQTKNLLTALEELLTAREYVLKKLKSLAQAMTKTERHYAALLDFNERGWFDETYKQIAENNRNDDPLATHGPPNKSE